METNSLLQKIKDINSCLEKLPNDNENINVTEELISFLTELSTDIKEKKTPKFFYLRIDNILDSISANINRLLSHSSYNGGDDYFLEQINSWLLSLQTSITYSKITYDFYKNLNFFNNNLVIVGANGSGKSTLLSNLKTTISEKIGIVIPAQKLFIVPTFDSIPSYESSTQQYNDYQQNSNDKRLTYTSSNAYIDITSYGEEYKNVLQLLLSERIQKANDYYQKGYLEKGNIEEEDNYDNKLDKAIDIWNYLIEHREMFCDGSNIKIKVKENGEVYPAYQMSDGEKNILYLIGRVLLASNEAMIIVDEPEMYLHKAIINKLWDKLETERKDCIFVYLTHDLDFASSRNAKKHWIKNFTYPNTWEFEEIKENEIPENLLMKLLGSRKKVLFCEGKKSSLDVQLYEILFPNYTITPVGSCSKVIQYTRAFNQYPSKEAQAFGIIDRDFRTDEQIKKLKTEQVYSYDAAEIENLFLIEDFISAFAKYKNESIDIIKIKDKVFSLMFDHKEKQILHYVTSYINYIFSEKHLKCGGSLEGVKTKLDEFQSEIDIDKKYNERKNEYEKIVNNKDYNKAILIYNNKGLHNAIEEEMNYSSNSYRTKALGFLKCNEEARDILRKYFPTELFN